MFKDLFDLYLCVCVWVCGTSRSTRHPVPQSWSEEQLRAARQGCWELNLALWKGSMSHHQPWESSFSMFFCGVQGLDGTEDTGLAYCNSSTHPAAQQRHTGPCGESLVLILRVLICNL